MAKKLAKVLMTTVACATLVVGAGATVLASRIDPNCPHDYTILEDSGRTYDDLDDDNHRVNYWEEVYCMDCGDYIINTERYEESHTYNSGGYCVDCGHVND